MPLFPLLLAAATVAADTPEDTIVITAARHPVSLSDAPASATVVTAEQVDDLALPFTADVIRLLPGVTVAESGPPGSQAQVRIRGAEANHSLLFVDGIRFNDPAAANEARFELLTNEGVDRIELIRGPQSALWGSEALGGVIAVDTIAGKADPRASLRAEYGSHESARLSGAASGTVGEVGLAASAGWLRGDGIDAFGRGGEKDGFDNSSASLKATYAPSRVISIGAVGHWLKGESEFDGFDPVTFERADTLDSTRNRILAGRGWIEARLGGDQSWTLSLDASLLASRNRNELDQALVNTTHGRRFTTSAQLSKQIAIGTTRHVLTAAAEYQKEDFRSRDPANPATDQSPERNQLAFAGEWRAEWSRLLASDVAVRHDDFSDFANATTIRANLLVRATPDLTLHIGYGEGVAQPSFYELYGFFPNFFVGNPGLRPETGHSWEAGLRWSRGRTSLSASIYSGRLEHEILSVFSPVTTTVNASGKSRRRGFELEAEHSFGDHVSVRANYSYLDADEPVVAADVRLRELRRAKHNANVVATAAWDPVRVTAALAYVGERGDVQDVFPYGRVKLDDYLLATLNLAWAISDQIEAYARIENVLDADYQDVFGYATMGRTAYAGIRLRFGD